jgi:hypothetical protein
MNVKKHCLKYGFPFIYMNDVCYCTDALGEDMIKKKHYTPQGEHPDDRIYRDKVFINRLQKHIDAVFEDLAHDLRLNEKGKDWLFDFVYNCDELIEFEKYLEKYDIEYQDLAK